MTKRKKGQKKYEIARLAIAQGLKDRLNGPMATPGVDPHCSAPPPSQRSVRLVAFPCAGQWSVHVKSQLRFVRRTRRICLTSVRLHRAAAQPAPAAAVAAAPSRPMPRHKMALIIGLNYKNSSITNLKNCVNDATDIAGLLKRMGFVVTLLTDSRSKLGIRDISRKVRWSLSSRVRIDTLELHTNRCPSPFFSFHTHTHTHIPSQYQLGSRFLPFTTRFRKGALPSSSSRVTGANSRTRTTSSRRTIPAATANSQRWHSTPKPCSQGWRRCGAVLLCAHSPGLGFGCTCVRACLWCFSDTTWIGFIDGSIFI
jgi:hypothetical protein